MFEYIANYFASDPLKLLYLVGGTGGIWYWISQWRDRIRIRVRIRRETFDVKEAPNIEVTAEYEIENIGGRVTSLDPTLTVSGYTRKKEYEQASFEVVGLERELTPFKPKLFQAVFKVPANYPFLLFRTYTFRPTRGSRKKLRVWSASKRNIGFWRFCYEIVRFKVFGIYKEPKT